jgi:hypothetical protein
MFQILLTLRGCTLSSLLFHAWASLDLPQLVSVSDIAFVSTVCVCVCVCVCIYAHRSKNKQWRHRWGILSHLCSPPIRLPLNQPHPEILKRYTGKFTPVTHRWTPSSRPLTPGSLWGMSGERQLTRKHLGPISPFLRGFRTTTRTFFLYALPHSSWCVEVLLLSWLCHLVNSFWSN